MVNFVDEWKLIFNRAEIFEYKLNSVAPEALGSYAHLVQSRIVFWVQPEIVQNQGNEYQRNPNKFK